jgi:hypothetical protein
VASHLVLLIDSTYRWERRGTDQEDDRWSLAAPANASSYGYGRAYKKSGACSATTNFTIVAVGYDYFENQHWNHWSVSGL